MEILINWTSFLINFAVYILSYNVLIDTIFFITFLTLRVLLHQNDNKFKNKNLPISKYGEILKDSSTKFQDNLNSIKSRIDSKNCHIWSKISLCKLKIQLINRLRINWSQNRQLANEFPTMPISALAQNPIPKFHDDPPIAHS